MDDVDIAHAELACLRNEPMPANCTPEQFLKRISDFRSKTNITLGKQGLADVELS